MEDARIFVQVDKTVVRITGLSVQNLNLQQLEGILQKKLKTMMRVIGVTGSSIEMDVYGLEEQDILRDERGVIQAIAAADGITVTDVTHLDSVKKIHSVDFDQIPEYRQGECMSERWLQTDRDPSHGR